MQAKLTISMVFGGKKSNMFSWHGARALAGVGRQKQQPFKKAMQEL